MQVLFLSMFIFCSVVKTLLFPDVTKHQAELLIKTTNLPERTLIHTSTIKVTGTSSALTVNMNILIHMNILTVKTYQNGM